MPWDEFMNTLNGIVMKYYAAMPKDAKMAILMGDVRRNGRCYSMFSDIVKPGQLEQVIVKAQHNCVSDGRKYANANFVPINHEILMVVKKVSELIMYYSIPKAREMDIRDTRVSTWKDVVLALVRDRRECSNEDLYRLLEKHKKAQANPHYKDKIRQTLQQLRDAGFIRFISAGIWAAA